MKLLVFFSVQLVALSYACGYGDPRALFKNKYLPILCPLQFIKNEISTHSLPVGHGIFTCF